MYSQSKIESLIEATLNLASGAIISFLVMLYIVPVLFGVHASPSQSIGITVLYTFISIARSYVWRRYFNARLHKRVHKLIGELSDGHP